MAEGKAKSAGRSAGRNTRPGAVDDNAMKRQKENTRKKKNQLRAIFDDNDSGRYSGPTDK